MTDRTLYYRHSGKFNPASFVSMLGVGIVAAIVLGAAYGIIVFYMPIVYVNMLLTGGMGFLIGVAIRKSAMKMHIRNVPLVVFTALVSGIVAEYVAFVAWILAVSGWTALIMDPAELSRVLAKVAESGVWSIKGSTVSGPFLIGIWIAEALVVLGSTVYFAHDVISNTPYCEACGQWMPNRAYVGPFEKSPDPQNLRESMERGDFAVLGEFKPLASDAPISHYCDFELIDCPTCDDMAVVSVRDITLTADNEGKITTKIKPIVNQLLIDRASCELIKELAPQPGDAPPAAEAAPAEGEEAEGEEALEDPVEESPEIDLDERHDRK